MYKRGSGALIIGVFLILVSLSFASIDTVKAAQEEMKYDNSKFCNDSDGGIFTFQQGEITYNNFLGLSRTLKDYCIHNKLLRERYCKNGKLQSIESVCEEGCDYQKGECKEDERLRIWNIYLENYNEEITYPVGTVFSLSFSVTAYSEKMLEGKKISLDIERSVKEKGSTIGVHFSEPICEKSFWGISPEEGEEKQYTMKCKTSWIVGEGSFTEPETYTIRANVGEGNNKKNKEMKIVLRLKANDPTLCAEVIKGHNKPEAERVNIIIVGIGYDSGTLSLSCNDAMWSYCISLNYRGYRASSYLPVEKSMKFLCYDKQRDGDPLPPKPEIEKTVSLSELNEYNSQCKESNTPPGEVVRDFSKYLIKDAVFDGKASSLLSVEPFKSNSDKFNFWYVKDTIPYLPCKSQENGGMFSCYENIERGRALATNCVLPNKYITYAIASYFRSSAGNEIFLSAYPSRSESPYLNGFDARTFIHEFGHQFGNLGDEYIERQGSQWKEGEPSYRANCFSPVPLTKDACLTQTMWKDLIGNGCGKSGVIDCDSQDELYSAEVGCFESCSYTEFGIYRPTFNSIMRNHHANPFTFGPWNEKLIKYEMDKFSGV